MIKHFLSRGIPLILYILCVNVSGWAATPSSPLYAVAEYPTVVLNTPAFASVFGGANGNTLKTDKDGLIREVEFIALPGTVFSVFEVYKEGERIIYGVRTEEYPGTSSDIFYINSAFVSIHNEKPRERKRSLPSKDIVINNLLNDLGTKYVWGGNVSGGIPEMIKLYEPSGEITRSERDKWILKGVDCSGLLYQATGGYTPRNTSRLVYFGEGLKIKGSTLEEICGFVEPLDIIVWKGHVIMVLDKDTVIESRLDYDKNKKGRQGGVRKRSLRKVLSGILEDSIAVDDYDDPSLVNKRRFVIRRWHNGG
jgi:cell wall-associated NlpC family hydrolase